MTNTFVQHCITLYTALDDRATFKTLKSGEKVRVFAGVYTEVFSATGLSRTYYTSTRRALERHNAIKILQKGSRGADSVILLAGLPENWEIEGWNDGHLTTAVDSAKLRSVAEELQEEFKKSTGGINVAAALAEFEKRVVTLETQVEEILTTLKSKRKTKENK